MNSFLRILSFHSPFPSSSYHSFIHSPFLINTHILSHLQTTTKMSKSSQPPTLCTLPVDVLIDIALALPCREFGRLLQTNRYIHHTLDTHWVWHQRFVIRLGQALLAAKLKQVQDDASASSLNVAPTPTAVDSVIPDEVPKSNLSMTSSATKQQLIDWYRHYGTFLLLLLCFWVVVLGQREIALTNPSC